MFQLHSSHHQAVCVRSLTGNVIPVAYIRLKLINGRRYHSLTYSVIRLLQVKKVRSVKRNVQIVPNML